MVNTIHNEQVVQQAQVRKTNTQKTIQSKRPFQSYVEEVECQIHISNHAQKRMQQRGIHLDSTDLSKLDLAFSTLDKKGSENSLIIYDDLSLIASVKNRTIITASPTDEMTEVTNIDSAIHIKK